MTTSDGHKTNGQGDPKGTMGARRSPLGFGEAEKNACYDVRTKSILADSPAEVNIPHRFLQGSKIGLTAIRQRPSKDLLGFGKPDRSFRRSPVRPDGFSLLAAKVTLQKSLTRA
jgi:hypothetical protein